LLDTSMSYGGGHNERLLARVLAARREEVVLATKFGIVRDANGRRGQPRSAWAGDRAAFAAHRETRTPS
jgi:aryl-alcohol dehydrogenase-like predicted oxidoreductase